MRRIDFVTLFPEIVRAMLADSIMKRAADAGFVSFGAVNPRDFCYDAHQKVDDTPYGGEPGMLIKAEPVALALESIGIGTPEQGIAVISTDPTGAVFSQKLAAELSECERIVFLCGHYEGIDQRVVDRYATHTISIGDFVLTNGELPALVMADAIVRLIPGVLGSPESLQADSHNEGLLAAPNYTRPEIWRDVPIPAVLKSGDHGAIAKWRREQSLKITKSNRPELLARANLDKRDLDMLFS